MLFKILHGDVSNISTDITPFHEGWAYVTHDGYFYIDLNIGTEESPDNQRIKLNAQDAETLGLHTANEFLLKTELLQANWTQTDPTQPDYIKNKPKTGAVFYASISNNVFMLEETGLYVASITDNKLIIA